MTEATLQALNGLRDLTMIKWYIIPLLAIVIYIYAKEIKLAKEIGKLECGLCGCRHLRGGFLQRDLERVGAALHPAQRVLDHARRHGAAHHGGMEHRDHVHVRPRGHHLLSHPYREQEGEDPGYSGDVVLGHRLFGILRLCGVPAEHGRPPGMGVSLLVSLRSRASP